MFGDDMENKNFKKLILMQNGKQLMFDSKKDIVKYLLDDDYYSLSSDDKKKRIELKTLANSIGNKKLHSNNLFAQDETIYIYWLLMHSNVVLLERKDSNILTKDLDKRNISDDYVIVNNFASQLLERYIKK